MGSLVLEWSALTAQPAGDGVLMLAAPPVQATLDGLAAVPPVGLSECFQNHLRPHCNFCRTLLNSVCKNLRVRKLFDNLWYFDCCLHCLGCEHVR